MKKETKENKFIKSPSFKGGMKALRAFVASNLKYPPIAFENKIEGTVHLRYSIDRNGKTFNIRVIKGIGNGCNEEARRIVSLFKFEMPKNRAGKLIFHKTLQIHFRLPKKSPESSMEEIQKRNLEINYTVNKTNDKGNYEYSIDL